MTCATWTNWTKLKVRNDSTKLSEEPFNRKEPQLLYLMTYMKLIKGEWGRLNCILHNVYFAWFGSVKLKLRMLFVCELLRNGSYANFISRYVQQTLKCTPAIINTCRSTLIIDKLIEADFLRRFFIRLQLSRMQVTMFLNEKYKLSVFINIFTI